VHNLDQSKIEAKRKKDRKGDREEYTHKKETGILIMGEVEFGGQVVLRGSKRRHGVEGGKCKATVIRESPLKGNLRGGGDGETENVTTGMKAALLQKKRKMWPGMTTGLISL